MLTKSVSLNQNTYDTNSNLYLISPTSPPPASVAAVRSPMHRLAVGAMTAAINKNPAPLSTASKALGQQAAQTQSDDTKNLSIIQNYQQIQLNNKNNDSSSSSKSNSATSSSASTIVPSATGAAIKPVLPSPAAMVADPPLGQGNSDANLDHNSLDELYKEPMYFGTENSTTITTQIGANAHLPCVIHHIGEGVVSRK